MEEPQRSITAVLVQRVPKRPLAVFTASHMAAFLDVADA
jgi:hypothetical protein